MDPMLGNALLHQPFDLLRQRRLQLGLPPQADPLRPAGRLLLLGGAAGLSALAAALLVWLLLGLRQAQVSAELGGLSQIPATVQALEGQAMAARRQLRKAQSSNEALAKALVAVSSGSALLSQLAAITPERVQLTEASVSGTALTLKGLASDPEAFRRVNVLSLLLADSPLFESKGVKVQKLSREAAGGTSGAAAAGKGPAPVAPVAWEIAVPLASLTPAAQLPLLQKLGADGMARRLQILQRAGVLP
jgi:type IV pilus assembly protein PilN